jgi:hypothetical protein
MKRTNGIPLSLLATAAWFLLILSSGFLQAQNLVNTGTFTNNSGGTIKVKGSLSAGQAAFGGTVEFNGTGAQTVPAITYTNLKATGTSGNKTFAGSTTVSGDITVNQTSGGFVLASTDTLTLQKITTVPVTVTSGSFDVSAGTTQYATGTQVIYGTTYKNLIAASGGKTTSGTVTIASGGTLTNSVTTDFGTNAFIGTGATFANTGTLQSAGSVTLGSGTSVNGTFSYYSGSAQTIADATYTGTLSTSGAGAKSVGNVTVSGTYSPGGAGARTYDGTFTYNAAGAQDIAAESYDSLSLSGSGTKTFTGATSVGASVAASVPVVISGSLTLGTNATATISDNLTANGTFDANASGATVNFNGGAQSLTGSVGTVNVTNLTLSGSAAKSTSLNFNVDGIFTPTRGIDMGSSAVLNITNPAAAAVASYGSGEHVKGIMKRAVNTAGSFYTYNDSATGITFAGSLPTDFTLNVDSSTTPNGYTDSTHVNRKVIASYTGWTGSATIQVGYRFSQKPSKDENKLRYFKGLSTTKLSTGNAAVRVASSSSSWGSVSLAGVTNAFLPTSTELILANSGAALITLADGGNWNNTGTWDEGYVPTANDDVEVAHTTSISTAVDAVASTLVIKSTGTLNVSSANLTVSGNASNAGTLNVSASRQVQVGSSGTGILTNSGTVTNDGTVVVGN